jgi:hypothetical protein
MSMLVADLLVVGLVCSIKLRKVCASTAHTTECHVSSTTWKAIYLGHSSQLLALRLTCSSSQNNRSCRGRLLTSKSTTVMIIRNSFLSSICKCTRMQWAGPLCGETIVLWIIVINTRVECSGNGHVEIVLGHRLNDGGLRVCEKVAKVAIPSCQELL